MQKYCRQKTTKALQEKKIGFSTRHLQKLENLCCKQALHMKSFKSSMTQKTCHIFHDLNCKSKLLIYLMELKVGKLHWKIKNII